MPDDAELRYELVEDGINTYMGHLFERFCAEYMVKHYACDAVGSWWGVEVDEEGERVGVDIDLVAKVRESGRRAVVYAECKFRNRMMKKTRWTTGPSWSCSRRAVSRGSSRQSRPRGGSS